MREKRESSKTKSSIRIILWILNIFSIGKTSAEEEEDELWMYYEAMAHIHTYAYVQIPYSPEGTGRQTNKHCGSISAENLVIIDHHETFRMDSIEN